MPPPSRAWTAGRLLVAGFCWLTAAYACVASSTFASLQFLQPRVFPWTGTFSDWHPAASWLWLAAAATLSWRDVRRHDVAGRLTLGLLVLLAAGVVWNTASPVLPSLAGGMPPLRTRMISRVASAVSAPLRLSHAAKSRARRSASSAGGSAVIPCWR